MNKISSLLMNKTNDYSHKLLDNEKSELIELLMKQYPLAVFEKGFMVPMENLKKCLEVLNIKTTDRVSSESNEFFRT